MLFEHHRILGTPTEKTWPGVSQLPDYKPNFPSWSGEGLRKAVPQLDNNGLDLLEVYCRCIWRCFSLKSRCMLSLEDIKEQIWMQEVHVG